MDVTVYCQDPCITHARIGLQHNIRNMHKLKLLRGKTSQICDHIKRMKTETSLANVSIVHGGKIPLYHNNLHPVLSHYSA